MSIRPSVPVCLLFLLVAAGPLVAQPSITDFSPTVGAPGDSVLLTGHGYATSGAFDVIFWNGKVVSSGFVNSDLQMTVTVPDGITTGPIGIQPVGGSTSFTATDFTAIGPGPYISDFSPGFGAVNDLITINGVHFAGATSVKFNGVSSTSFSPNAAGDQINARVPSGATIGPISVTTPLGTFGSASSFLVIGPGAYVTRFSPASGTSPLTVLIDGAHFTSATGANFNGQAGVNFAVQSDSLIRVDVPVNVTTGPIRVLSPLGNYTTASNFFAPPTITSVAPSTGRTGTNVTLIGANFLGATSVLFNGTNAAFSLLNNTNIQVAVPVHATTGLIRMITPAYSAFSPAIFTVQPVISGFSPGFGAVGSSVTISGANFNAGVPVIRFSGVQAAPPTGVTFGQLTALVPSGATNGPISITTSNGSYTTAINFFLPAFITSFTPTNSLPGSSITVKGTNFLGATAFTFNGAPAASFTVSNNNTLGATVPAGVPSGPLRVTTPAGTFSSAGNFYGAPLIADFAPRHGLPGTNVTIIGTNFLGAIAVRFNQLNAQIASVNNGQIVAVVPSGAQSGPITVVTPGGTNVSDAVFVLDYKSDLQISITNSPNPVTVGSNLLYTISIVNQGPFPAPHATFTNFLPPSVSLISASISSPWSLTTNGSQIIGTNSNYPLGNVSTLLLTVSPQSPGNILDTVTITSDNPDPSLLNNTASITTTVLPLPLLSIQLLTNQVKISWPSVLTNYLLQFKDTPLTDTFWSNTIATPVVSGAQKSVTEPNTNSERYYRLKQ